MPTAFRTKPFDVPDVDGGLLCTGLRTGPMYCWPGCLSAEEIQAAYDVMRVVRQQLSNEEMYALVQHRVVERRFDAWMDRLEE